MELLDYREKLDRIDEEIVSLFSRRMEIVAQIAEYKKEHKLPVLDAFREEEKLHTLSLQGPEGMEDSIRSLYSRIFELSRKEQIRRMGEKKCGLLGEKLGHSYSPYLHSRLADYSYRLFEKNPEELAEFLKNGDWDGLNVTIPYKKTVLSLCDELTQTARRIGSVNTLVRRPDGRVLGENTDAYGFSLLLRNSGFEPKGKKCLVLGSGGASAAVCDVLRQLDAREVVTISRKGENNYGNLHLHRDTDLLVNATPVGMYPHNGEAPVDLRQFPACCAVVDLIYNPARTALLLQAERLGIPCAGGLLMLTAQAKRSAELFSGREIPDSVIEKLSKALSKEMQNIVLIGMPGCGKSSLAKTLGEKLGRPVFDSDTLVEEAAGCGIPEIFEREGEEGFRRRETLVLGKLGKRSGAILSTGGGCVTREENYDLLHQNGMIFWRQRELSRLEIKGRPLSQGRDIKELFHQREPLYSRFADHILPPTESLEQAVESVLEVLA